MRLSLLYQHRQDLNTSLPQIHQYLMSINKEKTGWIDLADLQNYVCDYESSGLESLEDIRKGNVLFSNLVNDPAN